MRKTSIKALSLMLSLLLLIPVLCSLPFPVWAETEADAGDLNGDSLVDQSDIDILAAVLDGTQAVDTNINYDISGNRIVGSEDLVVLKNLVDPTNNPALPDKLADGVTDDLLVGATGTGLQGAVVYGGGTPTDDCPYYNYSTRAVGAKGQAVKVLFAEPKDWSLKKTLNVDALWAVGEEFGFTLLDADGNAIGAETTVTCVNPEWGAVEIPLNGTTSRARAAVGGFMISVDADAEVYLDNLSLVDMEAEDMSTVTREDMENALVEVAWDYYLKKGKVQYDSVEFNTRGDAGTNSPLSKDYGSAWRTNPFATLEDATSDSNIYSVCSDYCWSVYYEALGYPILGNRVNAVTPGLFINTQYPQDMAVLRWWDSGLSSNDLSRLKTHNNGVAPMQTHSAEEAIAFFQDWETNFQPGDIIVMHGNGGHQHAMLYVGNGQILHCGGGKFDMATGKDDTEPNGAIHLTSIDGTFFGYDQDGYFNLNNSGELGAIADANTYGAWLVVVRPLDVLTMDNGNGEDVLDLTYELNTGLMQYELANNTQRPVKTSGYDITDVTKTRLQYPGMNIDRTVSVKNYGTVTNGGQLTYTITITNNSNNENYITAYGKDSGYAGQTYTGLVVTETVPANTTYVSNVGGGTHADGTITWELADISAGSSVTISYTVTASGNLGDKIVCGSGTVAGIPSNVLTTTIGGQKLTNVDADFVSAGASAWNSETYKLSANPADGTDFAERVYNELTGLNLQLPTAQELADSFFTQEKLYQPYGLHQSHSKSLTRYMYTLNTRSEMAEAYQIYWDMLVEGYYGGIWVYSNDYNNEPRIIDPNVRYLETGDILVYMNLDGSVSGGLYAEERNVRSWRVLVYLGDNTFASLDSNAQMLKAEASAAVAALTYDMFLVLRPSQAYEDLNTEIEAFTGEVTWDETTDKAYAYAPPANSQLLSTENQALITALTATATDSEGNLIWTAGNLSFATQVYSEIGIDIRSDGLKGAAYSTLINEGVFEKDATQSYKYTLSTTLPLGYEELHTMVLYYGGTEFVTGHELTALEDLTVGDVVVLGNRDDGVSAYLCAVYQGKGMFLVVTRQYPDGDAAVPQVNSYYQEEVTDLAAWLSQSIYKDSEITTTYQGYVVLRPSNAYEDINALRVRDITEGQLSDDEKAKLESLTIQDWLYDGRAMQFNNFPGWAYRRAFVDMDDIIADKTATNAQESLFKKVNGKLVPLVPGDAKYDATYANMLVHSLYGGAQTKNPGRLLSESELQVGDIFVAAKVNTNEEISGSYVYRVALYQGGTKFLITECVSGGEGTAWTSETEIIGEDYSTWLYYFVLRPEQVVYTESDLWSICLEDFSMIAGETKDLVLVTAPSTFQPETITWETSDKSVATVDANGTITAHRIGECTITATCGGLTTSCTVTVPMRSITTGILTSEEMDILKNYSTDTSALARALAVNAYAAADIDISTFFGGLSFFNIQEKILDSNGDLLASTASGYDVNFATMLVPGYYGGGYNATKSSAPTGKTFVPDDFKVGDLFLAVCEASCEHSKKWTYISGLYIGEGKFLMMRHNSSCSEETCRAVTIDEYNVTADSAVWGDLESLNAYRFYFVLRPERLAARSITSGALTPEEIDAISKLTSLTTGKNPGYVADEVYSAVGIDISAVLSNQSITDIYKYVTDDTKPDYTKMLVTDYTGGSDLDVYPTFVPDDLKIGDLIMAYARVHCADCNAANTLTGVYIGDGQFLVAPKNIGTVEACATYGGCYIDAYADVESNSYSIWGEKTNFTKYFILRPERLAPVSLDKSEVTLYRNEEATLNIAVKPDTYNSLTWASSNEEVATVDASGNVTGKSAGTAVITANCDGYKASCVVTVSGNRLITSGALTEEEKAAIQTYVPEATFTVGPFIKHAYELANIDLTSAVGTDSFFNMQDKLFDTTTGLPLDTQDETYAKMLLPGYYGGKRYSANSGEDGRTFVPADFKVGDVFIAAQDAACAVGGARWVYITGVYIGDGKFVVAENHSSANCTDCSRVYTDAFGVTEGTAVWGNAEAMKAYRYYFVLRPERLAPDALQSISLSDATVEKNATTTLSVTKDPADAAPNATVTWVSSDETVATVDANGVVTGVSVGSATITAYCDGNSASCTVTVTARNITSGALVKAEMDAIADYTTEETPFWYGFAAAAYKNADVTVDAFNTSDTFNTLRANVFSTTESDYTKMLVPGYYGGSKKVTGKTFVPADLKIGDIIATATAKCANGSWTYLTGIYQGEGKFFVSKRCCNQDGCSLVYEDIYGAELTDGKLANGMTSFWSDAAALEAAYEYYFVLRPERLASDALRSISLSDATVEKNATTTLSVTKDPADAAPNATVTWVSSDETVATVDANGKVTGVSAGSATITAYCDGNSASCTVTVTARNITSGALTDDEMTAIGGYTSNTAALWYAFVTPAYTNADIVVDAFDTNIGFNDLRSAVLSTTESDYTKMLLPGSTGGSKLNTGRTFVPADLKVGDIIATATAKCSHGSWQYLTGIYVGDGKFLVSKRSCSTEGCAEVYTDAYGAELTNGMTSFWSDAAALEAAYEYYFVLRPERLASDAIQSIAMSQTELTLDYTAAGSLPAANAATLTFTKDPTSAVDPVNVVWTTSNPDVATVADGKITAVGAGKCTITVNCDGYTATCEVTITRKIEARTTLTATEQAAIANYDTENGYVLWYTLGTNAYATANITVDAFNTKLGFNDLKTKVLSTTEVTDYSKMLVPGYYGGYSKNTGRTFVPEDLKVGDIICTSYGQAADKCGSSSSAWRYVTALYKGNDTLLVVVRCCNTGECVQVYEDVYNSNGTTSVPEGYISFWSDADTLNSEFGYYFVLRPSQLAD